MAQFDDLLIPSLNLDIEGVNPILLVKDFDSTGFTTDNTFMTNADTPYLALNGLIDDPINPFTGNSITEYSKNGDQLIYISNDWNVNFNNGTQFNDDPDGVWIVFNGDSIYDQNSWSVYTGTS